MVANADAHLDDSPTPGSQSGLRHANQMRVFQALSNNGPMTQVDLARATGLSRATISNLVKIMQVEGIVRTEPTTSSGRRATSVSLNPGGAVAVGIDIGRTHVRVVLATLDYQVLAEESAHLPLGHNARDGVITAKHLLESLFARTGRSRHDVIGVGVGIPGPIDRRKGTVVTGAILPDWVGINILEVFRDELDLPIFIDNDANLGALAEVSWGPHPGVSDLVFIKVGSGIGAGLVLDGRIFYGRAGVTGEIGHATIFEQGSLCRCGNRGCLETVASVAVMTELLAQQAGVPVSVDDFVARALASDRSTIRVLEDAAAALGRSVANLANLLNPEMIIFGGPLAPLGEILLDPIRRDFLRYSVPTVNETTTLAVSTLGDRAESLGAAALVFQKRSLAAAPAVLVSELTPA